MLHLELTVAFCLLAAVSPLTTYSGDRVLRVFLDSLDQWNDLEQTIMDAIPEVDIWSEPGVDLYFDVHVTPLQYDVITDVINEYGLRYIIKVTDLQGLIDKSNSITGNPSSKVFGSFFSSNGTQSNTTHNTSASTGARHKRRTSMSNAIIGTYATFNQIRQYLYDAQDFFPEIVSLKEIGRTYEDRPLLLVKIGKSRSYSKPAIWLDSGVHAREWISPATAMYIIYRLLRGYLHRDVSTLSLLTDMDIYILPVANPDGYVYSHEHHRLWRKNRSPNPPPVDDTITDCNGTDINRNWNFHWGEIRSSSVPCSITYAGSAPESELETQAISRALLQLRGVLYVYISVHSYAQTWFTRWAFTQNETDSHNETLGLARLAVEAINQEGLVKFRAGRSFEFLYTYSGGSPDWAHAVAGIPYSYALELRDRGDWGFLLPASYIDVSGREIYAGLRVVTDHICALACHLTNLTSNMTFITSSSHKPNANRYLNV